MHLRLCKFAAGKRDDNRADDVPGDDNCGPTFLAVAEVLGVGYVVDVILEFQDLKVSLITASPVLRLNGEHHG